GQATHALLVGSGAAPGLAWGADPYDRVGRVVRRRLAVTVGATAAATTATAGAATAVALHLLAGLGVSVRGVGRLSDLRGLGLAALSVLRTAAATSPTATTATATGGGAGSSLLGVLLVDVLGAEGSLVVAYDRIGRVGEQLVGHVFLARIAAVERLLSRRCNA